MPEPQGQPPENRSSLSSILLIASAMFAVYYGFTHFFRETPPPEEHPESASAEGPPSAAEQARIEERRRSRADRGRTGTIHTDHFEATIDNLGAGIVSLRLLDPRFRSEQTGEQEELVTTELEDYRPLRVSVPGVEIPPDAVWSLTQESERSVVLSLEADHLEIRRRIAAGAGPYQLWQTVVLRNHDARARRLRLEEHAFHYVTRAQEHGPLPFGLGGRSTFIGQGICRHDGEVVRKARADLATAHGFGGAIDFVGVENQYFAQVLAPSDEAAERCGLWAQDRYLGTEIDGTLFEARLRYPVIEIPPGGEHMTRTLAFFGPKEWDALQVAGHSLPEVVNLGTFAVIARQFSLLLAFIQRYVGNWGLAIIILTMLVRLALYPVMARQFRAFAPMRKLKPEMDAINAKFPGDMEKRQAAIMELYKKHGINPAAQMLGCLPVLLQMPVFFALYTSLQTNIELYHQPFYLWWHDLSAPDPYFSLPIGLAALMHVQQRLTPTQMEPTQQRVMLWMMPIMMGVFMLFLPSGLCLYMLTNSSLSITQQRFNEWRWQREEEEKAARASGATEGKIDDAPSAATRAESAPTKKPSVRRPPRG